MIMFILMIVEPKDKYIDVSENVETKSDFKSYN